MTWADEQYESHYGGPIGKDSTGQMWVAPAPESTPDILSAAASYVAVGNDLAGPISYLGGPYGARNANPAEGLHLVEPMAYASAGTMTFYGVANFGYCHASTRVR